MDKIKTQKESVLTVTLNNPKAILNDAEVRTKPHQLGDRVKVISTHISPLQLHWQGSSAEDDNLSDPVNCAVETLYGQKPQASGHILQRLREGRVKGAACKQGLGISSAHLVPAGAFTTDQTRPVMFHQLFKISL